MPLLARTMALNIGRDILEVFDVPEEEFQFFADIIANQAAPEDEIKRLWEQSLLGGALNWHYMIQCASSLRQSHDFNNKSTDANDTSSSIWKMVSSADLSPIVAWQDTDRLILKTRAQLNGSVPTPNPPERTSSRDYHNRTSHYWSNYGSNNSPAAPTQKQPWRDVPKSTPVATSQRKPAQKSPPEVLQPVENPPELVHISTVEESPYFYSSPDKRMPLSRRRLPGVVSCIPFPPLSNPNFGIIQETLGHEPFWLLVAITFLIKTSGSVSIPVFHKLKARFPSMEEIADPANGPEIVEMIQHLGLSMIRLKYMQRYARTFLDVPPKAGTRYNVKNYESREVMLGEVPTDSHGWEIGHMTQGQYAMDSWRIFCRDELLGRAEDWNGKGREGEFQPEWMRVKPADKELRAFLRWMWMKEGWEWNPDTGEKMVLRDIVRSAVNEKRVEYDENGHLQMRNTPRPGP